MGSQCRNCKIGVVWSYFLDLVRTATAFCTICSLFFDDAGQPPSSALQYSSLEVMNAWTYFSASETVQMFRGLAMFLRWKNAVFVTWEIWFPKDRLLSNITPRWQTQRTVFAEIKMDAARVRVCLAIFKLMCNRSLNNEVILLSIYCLPLWF